jgi:hypothetical protein
MNVRIDNKEQAIASAQRLIESQAQETQARKFEFE